MRASGGPISLLGRAQLGFLAAVPFYVAEVFTSARDPYWFGWFLNEWFASLGALLVYWLFLTVVPFAVVTVVGLLIPGSRGRIQAILPASVAVTLAMYLVLRVGLPVLQLRDLEFALLASLGFGVTAGACRAWGGFAFGPASVAALGAAFSVLASVQVAASTLQLQHLGFGLAARDALTLGAVLGVLALVAGLVGARRATLGWGLAVSGLAFGIALPLFALRAADDGANRASNVGPNILLLTVDTMRADYLSVYGGETPTPVFEGLAARGARFDQAISLAPWTIPSLAGLFSSKYPPSVVDGTNRERCKKEVSLYSKISSYWSGTDEGSFVGALSAAGYTTDAFVSNQAMRDQRWLLDEFDSASVMPAFMNTIRGPFSDSPFLQGVVGRLFPSLYEVRPRDYTRVVGQAARAALRCRRSERFFLWVHYFDPHTPYDPPEEFRRRSGPFPFLPLAAKPFHHEDQDYLRSLYSGEIRYVDHSIGEVLAELRGLGLDDKTYIVVASDHGEEIYDHGRFGHGHTMFDELLRVPLLIAGPEIPPHAVGRPVSMIDLVPTMADWAGVEDDPQWRGVSWAKSLRAGEFQEPERPVFAQATGCLPPPTEALRAVYAGDDKLIVGMRTGKTRLYDRAADPEEQRDVNLRYPGRAEELRSELEEWVASFPATFGELKKQDGTLAPDEETIRNLRALGYLPAE